MENPQPSANLNYCLVCVQFRGRMWVAFSEHRSLLVKIWPVPMET